MWSTNGLTLLKTWPATGIIGGMPKKIHINQLPKTPGGKNISKSINISADEIEIDDAITVKRSMLRVCAPGNPWFEGEGDGEDETERPKFIVRKSMDLKKIRRIDDRVAAIVSSPMIDARPRRLSSAHVPVESSPYTRDDFTPLKVSNKGDLAHATSRRLSQIILRRYASSTPFPDTAQSTLLDSPTRRTESGSTVSQLHALPVSSLTTSALEDKENVGSSPKRSVTQNVVPKELDQQTPLDSSAQMESTDIANAIKDFRLLAEVESSRLKLVCGDWNGVLTEESDKLPQSVLDSIRATVGKCQLVLQHKLSFFLTLVDKAESDLRTTGAGGTLKINPNDLAGYWTLVATEIAESDASFDRLCKWRDEWHWSPAHCPVTPPRSVVTQAVRSKRVGPTPKRVGIPKVSDLSTKKVPPGRKLAAERIPQETSDTIARTVAKSAPRNKPRVKSKFAEFLAAKKAAASQDPSRPRKSLLEAITPLGLRPVTRSSTTPTQLRLSQGA
ncbi:unnamed protein product [Dicrocoelium dendriticum]|nr:unnamed protein product [Dicrocoelium dendriticum]